MTDKRKRAPEGEHKSHPPPEPSSPPPPFVIHGRDPLEETRRREFERDAAQSAQEAHENPLSASQ